MTRYKTRKINITYRFLLDQELIPYRYSSCAYIHLVLVVWDDAVQKGKGTVPGGPKKQGHSTFS